MGFNVSISFVAVYYAHMLTSIENRMKKSNEKRLQEKKIRGQKKQSRTKNFDD